MMKNHTKIFGGEHRRTGRIGGGFTLIELLIVISIIGLLMALLISGLAQATKSAKRSASLRSAAALVQSVKQFQNEFGFLPPLVHDGAGVSAGSDSYRPALPEGGFASDGPIFERTGGAYVFYTVTVWSEGLDYNFFRRRTGLGSDEINLSRGGPWDDAGAWEDRRYSKYSLAYYLTGVLDKDVDGVRGPGFARPIIDGSYQGVGYPVGSSRDRFEPLMDVDRRGVRIEHDYVDLNEYPEHDLGGSAIDRAAAYATYEAYQRDTLVALVDSYGNAFRYYRWEPGRFVNGQLVVENTLDLNLPPVLIDPMLFAKVRNDPILANETDMTSGDPKLRDGRFAIVSAGGDGLFGTESIETIAEYLKAPVPSGIEDIARMRLEVWIDNAAEVGN
jgi:prepilin-type N-terminal cleavage/methylation domain-containing protein